MTQREFGHKSAVRRSHCGAVYCSSSKQNLYTNIAATVLAELTERLLAAPVRQSALTRCQRFVCMVERPATFWVRVKLILLPTTSTC